MRLSATQAIEFLRGLKDAVDAERPVPKTDAARIKSVLDLIGELVLSEDAMRRDRDYYAREVDSLRASEVLQDLKENG